MTALNIDDRPDFLCIGAQKAGTTWLWRNLAGHPGIWMPPRKELHYFDRSPDYPSPGHLNHRHPLQRIAQPGQFPKTLRDFKRVLFLPRHGRLADLAWMCRYHGRRTSDSWYLSLFKPGRGRMRGEMTPEYSLLSPEEVERVSRLIPGLKVMMLLRDPIERAWSQLRFEWTRGNLSKPECLSDVKEIIDDPRQERRNDYMRTITIWEQHVGTEQLFIGFYDDIERDPQGLLSRVCAFLGVTMPDVDEGKHIAERVNASMQLSPPEDVTNYLQAKYRGQLEALSERFGGYASEWLARATDMAAAGRVA